MSCVKGVTVLLHILSVLPFISAKAIVLKGGSFAMECYNSGLDTDGYVDLSFTSDATSEKNEIARFRPSNKEAQIFDSSYNFRLNWDTEYYFTLEDVEIGDDGKYECQAFGFHVVNSVAKTEILEVQVKPTIIIKYPTNPLFEDSGPVPAAECIASDAKPVAKVYWYSGRLEFNQGNATTPGNEKLTTTTTSTLTLSPTKYYNAQPFSCFIEHPTLLPDKVNVSIVTLDVRYHPATPHIRVVDSNKKLNCTSDGNPIPTITWTMPNGNTAPVPSPGSSVVRIVSPTLPERQNDTYVCTASNGIEPRSTASITTAEAVEYKEIVKTSNTGLIVGVVVGVILLILVIAALVYWFFIRRQREEDSGPYKPNKKISRPTNDDDEGGWSRSSGRPMIQHANESLNKNAPPSPSRPPPADDDEEEGSNYSQSDVEEFTEGHDVELNSPQTADDDEDMPVTGIVSKNSVNFQHRRQRPSTSPHRQSQNRGQPQPIPRAPQQSDPHYEVPPKEDYYDDDYDQEGHRLMGDHPHHEEEPMDERFYDRPEDRYPGYPSRYDEPPHDEHLPPYSDTVQYASIDHGYNPGKQRTRPPYQEPVEYAEIRSKGQIV